MLKKYRIYKLDEINLDNIVYTKPHITKIKQNTNYIDIFYNDPELGIVPFILELPKLNIIDYISEVGLILELDDNKSFFDKLDDKFINYFKENMNMLELCNNIKYKTIVKKDKYDNDKYNGIIKLTLLDNKNLISTIKTTIFDKNKHIILSDNYKKYLKNGKSVRSMIEISTLWIKNDLCGAYLKLYQLSEL